MTPHHIIAVGLLACTLGWARPEDGAAPKAIEYWSYQPVHRPPVPETEWATDDGSSNHPVLNPIDAFISAERAKRGLAASPPAEPAVLLRRVYLDLTGLPPTREELRQFLADPSPAAYARVVDRLLASPQYGERWGRHWMDVWRYSDWYGSRSINEIRYSQRHIWRWRDWIVESVNADKGYDQMILEMIAGDELAPADPTVTRATGFIGRNWYKFDRNVWMFDAVEHSAQAFLGLTLRCARCHDHKFDPISQQDYYRFRAFFEPHDVRTDPLSGTVGTEKDATLGPVLRDGVARVYDKDIDVPTFVFARGDNRYPDDKQRMQPGVPAALGSLEPGDIRPIRLAPESYAPSLREPIVNEMIEAAVGAVIAAQAGVAQSRETVAAAEQLLSSFIDREASGLGQPTPVNGTFFSDRFDKPQPDVWQVASGQWDYENGHVAQKVPGSFPTMVARVQHPQDFSARLRYRTTNAGTIHSVGIFFDAASLRDCQAVYTATNDKTSTVQAFHRQAGMEHYPSNGIFQYPLYIGQEITLDLAVRGQQLNVWINGELALAYTMPVPRQSGNFALWTHAGTAEFYELLIDPLPPEIQLAQVVAEKTRSPYTAPSKSELEFGLKMAQRTVAVAAQKLAVAEADQDSLQARIAADRAKINESPEFESIARHAAAAERQAKVAQADLELLVAANNVFSARARQVSSVQTANSAAGEHKAVREAEAKLAAAEKLREAARAEAQKQDASYTAIGPMYPKMSSGRRLALARWIAGPNNPRTARVAVNHIWLRHFGQAIVPTVANFGMNGGTPSHPELLDWLAAEFMEHDWSMKHLHRLIVLSDTYRQTSAISQTIGTSPELAAQNAASTKTRSDPVAMDPENRWLWRMNSRRMESEAVRDSILFVSGQLDTALGGPEIAESLGQDSHRRSLYFRSTPNEKMPLLEAFDQANPNECYRRQESIMPQQSLTLSNSALSLNHARLLARRLTEELGAEDSPPCVSLFIRAAFEQVLSRPPNVDELDVCQRFLARDAALISSGAAKTPFPGLGASTIIASDPTPHLHARENLVHVLFNHNDFVTVR